jgi:hypothetical protein
MDEWIQEEVQQRATQLAQAGAKGVEEYEAEWVAEGRTLSKRGTDGYPLKVGVLMANVSQLLSILEMAELYVPEPQAEPEET